MKIFGGLDDMLTDTTFSLQWFGDFAAEPNACFVLKTKQEILFFLLNRLS